LKSKVSGFNFFSKVAIRVVAIENIFKKCAEKTSLIILKCTNMFDPPA
jgi:hypothetical protein